LLLVDFDRSVDQVSNNIPMEGLLLDLPVNPPHKCIRCQKPNGPGQQTIDHARQEAVREEKNAAHKSGNVQLEDEIPDAISKYPNRAGTANEERLPPPVIVLFGISDRT
jgi:hypothetical protein